MTKTEEMYRMVAAQSQSGKTKRAFAESRGMKYATFQYWSKRHREQHSDHAAGEFISLTETVEAKPRRESSMLVVTLESGTRVEIR